MENKKGRIEEMIFHKEESFVGCCVCTEDIDIIMEFVDKFVYNNREFTFFMHGEAFSNFFIKRVFCFREIIRNLMTVLFMRLF
ncbi:hypothetical protein MCY_01096 [Bartonella rattimassiliensis 15908]|uniref:Uncharacterized protein n=1 Tax=Bartonella rattimassiliensis 15908 TaxID=1094556 RepID=J1JMN2_9HYPH|nr:hypothetical protein MCY_01096 [Bartonella rattimassiliensis 15908]